MNSSELIGLVAAKYLQSQVTTSWTPADGTARFVVDRLSAEQMAAVARAILAIPTLNSLVDIRLPAAVLAGAGLPPEVLTDKPATYWRTAECPKPVLLLANTGDDEQQSLAEIPRIGAGELQAHPDLWVGVASEGLALRDEEGRWWQKALGGLQSLRSFSLEREAAYVLMTREAMTAEGLPLLSALGAALPALKLPCDRRYFLGIKDRLRGHTGEWKKHFDALARKRGCYLLKRTPSQILLAEDELVAAFARVRDLVPEKHHPTVEAFIHGPSGWSSAAAQLAEIEWELIKPLFDGLRRERLNLGQETLAFYDERDPRLVLDADEREYLQKLVARATTEPKDEDGEFYEAHRDELRDNPKIKAAWDRFVYGRPRETDDFVAGLVATLEV